MDIIFFKETMNVLFFKEIVSKVRHSIDMLSLNNAPSF